MSKCLRSEQLGQFLMDYNEALYIWATSLITSVALDVHKLLACRQMCGENISSPSMITLVPLTYLVDFKVVFFYTKEFEISRWHLTSDFSMYTWMIHFFCLMVSALFV